MREILFRGKRKDNGNWIEGSLLNFRENTYIIPHDSEYCYDDTEKLAFDIEYFEVISETVGQYTGLKDVNGNKIFEDDMVEYQDGIARYFVVWDEKVARFVVAVYDEGLIVCDFLFYTPEKFKIISNIHDNPELLKGEICTKS